MSLNQIDQFRSLHSTALIGFDEIFKRIKELEKPVSSHPPYDIIRVNSEKFYIQLAVAGYKKEHIQVNLDRGKLTISGTKDDTQIPDYIYHGISHRDFKREFTLADTIEVEDVVLKEGILTVFLKNNIPEHQKPRTFSIR